jgi:hypothetical protein
MGTGEFLLIAVMFVTLVCRGGPLPVPPRQHHPTVACPSFFARRMRDPFLSCPCHAAIFSSATCALTFFFSLASLPFEQISGNIFLLLFYIYIYLSNPEGGNNLCTTLHPLNTGPSSSTHE